MSMRARLYQEHGNGGWAYRVNNGPSGAIDDLDDLLMVLQNYEVDERQMVELPTFGGKAPVSTEYVWSWDECRLLVGTCRDDFDIVPR